jgi:hypothetical protein
VWRSHDRVGGKVSSEADEKAAWVPITVLFSRLVIRRTVMALILTIASLFGSYSITGWMQPSSWHTA